MIETDVPLVERACASRRSLRGAAAVGRGDEKWRRGGRERSGLTAPGRFRWFTAFSTPSSSTCAVQRGGSLPCRVSRGRARPAARGYNPFWKSGSPAAAAGAACAPFGRRHARVLGGLGPPAHRIECGGPLGRESRSRQMGNRMRGGA